MTQSDKTGWIFQQIYWYIYKFLTTECSESGFWDILGTICEEQVFFKIHFVQIFCFWGEMLGTHYRCLNVPTIQYSYFTFTFTLPLKSCNFGHGGGVGRNGGLTEAGTTTHKIHTCTCHLWIHFLNQRKLHDVVIDFTT